MRKTAFMKYSQLYSYRILNPKVEHMRKDMHEEVHQSQIRNENIRYAVHHAI